MRRRVKVTLSNPLLLVLFIAISLLLSWQYYTHVGLALSTPDPNHNLMPNSDFDILEASGVPSGWQLNKSGDISYQTSVGKGHVGGSSFSLNVTNYNNGAAALTSPKVTIQPNQSYLFKGYYKASTRFSLLARYYYKNGTNQLMYIKTYPGNADTWSTVSDAFMSSDNITAVQLVYQMTSAGILTLNGEYLEPKQNIYIAPTPTASLNNIPYASLAATSYVNMPDGWTTYADGTNTADFSYSELGANSNLRVSVRNYESGEAKWQYAPQPVTGHQYYQFSVSYKSDKIAQPVVEYVTQNGERQFDTLDTLMPTNDWTTVHYSFEVPPGAVSMFVSVVLQGNGNLSTRDYSLANITKPGVPSWSHPLVSITFDDGWQSVYTTAYPLLNRYGYKATLYINPSSIETPNFMSAAELQTLGKSGEEIAAHGYAHDDMTTINDDQLDYQLHNGRDYLREAGYETNNFATPYGNSDAEVQWYARKYFQTLRGTETGINTLQDLDPYNLKVLYVSNSTQPQTIEAALQRTSLYNGWLILVYHSVGHKNPPIKSLKVENDTISTDNFVKQINLVKKSNITVLPIEAAYSEISHQL